VVNSNDESRVVWILAGYVRVDDEASLEFPLGSLAISWSDWSAEENQALSHTLGGYPQYSWCLSPPKFSPNCTNGNGNTDEFNPTKHQLSCHSQPTTTAPHFSLLLRFPLHSTSLRYITIPLEILIRARLIHSLARFFVCQPTQSQRKVVIIQRDPRLRKGTVGNEKNHEHWDSNHRPLMR
jgi:hypothetical protein